jgi:glutamate-1-semialdehyde aminotransferase
MASMQRSENKDVCSEELGIEPNMFEPIKERMKNLVTTLLKTLQQRRKYLMTNLRGQMLGVFYRYNGVNVENARSHRRQLNRFVAMKSLLNTTNTMKN